jgi:hypothetical protein
MRDSDCAMQTDVRWCGREVVAHEASQQQGLAEGRLIHAEVQHHTGPLSLHSIITTSSPRYS